MKKTAIAAVLLTGLFALAAPPPAEGSASVSISFFHDQLSPHGRWVVAGSYGDVWIPGGVAAGWAPYTYGEWVWTDYGWTWASYDPWGEIPFHYGTWVWADPYGWVWVPGTIWAPAWVTWAYTDDYIGWAPVPPSFVLSASGYYGRPVVITRARYVFVPTTRFVGGNIATARVPVQQNARIFARATKVTSYKISSGVVRTQGPPPAKIEKVIGRRIEPVSIDRAKTKPTTLADAGATKERTLRVAAPAKERGTSGKEVAGKPPVASATSATKREKAHRAEPVKPKTERTEAGSPGKPAGVEHGKPREHTERHSAAATGPETGHQQSQPSAAEPQPQSHQGEPPGQVKKEKPPVPARGRDEKKPEKEKH